jgi:hypothetical protein
MKLAMGSKDERGSKGHGNPIPFFDSFKERENEKD